MSPGDRPASLPFAAFAAMIGELIRKLLENEWLQWSRKVTFPRFLVNDV